LPTRGLPTAVKASFRGAPKFAGVETLYFNSFTTGTEPFFVAQVNNTFQASDTVSMVLSKHTIKTGFRYTWYKIKQNPDLVANGTFSFFGSGSQSTGNGFADFLLGLPDFYSQQSSPAFYESAADGGAFAQDSWRIRPNLTINYGLRWDYITP
jgi:outer membrane receptor protein involved in Fe transport